MAMLHLQDIVQQLMAAEGVQEVSTWLPVVVRLATTAAAMLSPMAAAAAEGGSIDPRRYIKVWLWHRAAHERCCRCERQDESRLQQRARSVQCYQGCQQQTAA